MRRVFFDTETTGTSVRDAHRVIEIGCVETIDFKKTGKVFHVALNPERQIDEGATRVHGKTFEMLKDEKKFVQVADEFIDFIEGAELIAHNAGFDVSFMNYELSLISKPVLRNKITDSLMIARRFFPGQPASLDALCKRFGVDNSKRTFHGALMDADLLCDMFCEMINFLQEKQGLSGNFDYSIQKQEVGEIKRQTNFAYRKFSANEEEIAKYKDFLKKLNFE